jgi:hypothetical protein
MCDGEKPYSVAINAAAHSSLIAASEVMERIAT